MNSTHFLLLVLLELSCGSEGQFSLSGFKLGPDKEDTACTTDGCYPETQGFTRPRSLKVDEETHKDLDSNVNSDAKGEFALVEKDENGSMLSKVSSSVSGAFSTASGYFKRTVYNKAANMTNDFAEKVREVFHEELYGFFEVMTKRFGDLLFSPGNAHSMCLCLVP